jgi:spermidine/putrescine transport system ATP-binding protein
VLLLDEPLAALDQELRQAMQIEIKRLQRTLGITFILVTHDQQEALALSDRVAVMCEGRIEQVGAPAEVFERPETAFVATFTGAANLWDAELLAASNGRLRLRLTNGPELEIAPTDGASRRPGDRLRLAVRPENLELQPLGHSAPAGGGRVVLPVTLEESIYQGARTVWWVRDPAGGRRVVHRPSNAPLSGALAALAPGTPVELCWDPVHTILLSG